MEAAEEKREKEQPEQARRQRWHSGAAVVEAAEELHAPTTMWMHWTRTKDMAGAKEPQGATEGAP